jgi:DMSO/TMAO reductase YedYZ molybdopterin-dependent catalytic subunit
MDGKFIKVEFILTSAIMAILLIIIIPTADASSTIEVTNLSRDTYTLTYQQLAEMPQTTTFAELFCYGNLITSQDWNGVQLSYLLTQMNVSSEVKSIQFTASDSYTVTIPIQLAMAPETIIAFQYDGAQMVDLRLILPGINGASWINRIVSINMGNNEVDAPAAVSGTGAPSSFAEYIIEHRQSPTAPTFAPNKTQPTAKPNLITPQ